MRTEAQEKEFQSLKIELGDAVNAQAQQVAQQQAQQESVASTVDPAAFLAEAEAAPVQGRQNFTLEEIVANQAANFGQGVTYGWADEMGINEADPEFNAAYPYSSMLAEGVGGLASGIGVGKLLKPASLAGTAMGLIGEGAVYGVGKAEKGEGVEQGLMGAATNLLFGGAMGGAVNLGAKFLGGRSKSVANWITNLSDHLTDQQKALSKQNTRKPDLPDSASMAFEGEAPMRLPVEQVHARDATIAAADELGIPMTAPERSGNPAEMIKQARIESDPVLASIVEPTYIKRQARVNEIAREQIGLSPGDNISRAEIRGAKDTVGGMFDRVAETIPTLEFDAFTRNMVDGILDDHQRLSIIKSPGKPAQAVLRMREMLEEGMSGAEYLEQRGQIEKAIKGLYESKSPDIRLADTYADMIETLDDAVDANLPPETRELWNEARRLWKNIKVVDQPNMVSGAGDFNMGKLRSVMNRDKGYRDGARQDEFSKLADVSDVLKFDFGRSGTAERFGTTALGRASSYLEKPFASNTIEGGLMSTIVPDIMGADRLGGAAALAAPEVFGKPTGGAVYDILNKEPSDEERDILNKGIIGDDDKTYMKEEK